MAFGEASGQGFNNPVQSLLLLVIQKSGQGIFIYSPTVGAGNLVGSWTNSGGVDKYGNPYKAGLEVGNASGPQIAIVPGSPATLLEFIFNNPTYSNALLTAASSFGQISMTGSQSNVAGRTDFVQTQWNANSGFSAEWIQSYTDANGVTNDFLFLDYQGLSLQGASILAIQPGTGTSPVNAAQIETWHNLSLSGWSVASGYHARYRIGAEGDLQLSGRINSGGTSLTIASVPSGYFQLTSPQMSVPLDAIAMATSATTASPRIAVSNGGLITIAGCTVNTSSVISLDGISFPISAG